MFFCRFAPLIIFEEKEKKPKKKKKECLYFFGCLGMEGKIFDKKILPHSRNEKAVRI